MKQKDDENLHVKILTLGQEECGKTCLIKRYCEQRFEQKYIPTIGIDYGVKKLTPQKTTIAVN